MLPPATQGQTRLSLLGLSNILRWTSCLPSPLLEYPIGQITDKLKRRRWLVKAWAKVGCGALLPDCNSRTQSRLSPSTPHNSGPLRLFQKSFQQNHNSIQYRLKSQILYELIPHFDRNSDVYTTITGISQGT